MLKIHFLNVGKGNCTIIDHISNRLSIVDIDNSHISDENDVLTDPVEYMNKNFKGRSIFRFILTHPDMDHMSGIHELSEKHEIINFWDTDHDKSFGDDSWGGSSYKKEDWDKYLKHRTSTNSPKCIKNLRHSISDYWNEDKITVLSPSPALTKLSKDSPDGSDKHNHISYVLMVEHAGKKILLGGDATTAAWDDIYKTVGKEGLKADIFLAPHHGSKNNVNEEVFKHINPDYVVVSVNRGVQYDYNYYNSLAKKQVLSTKHFGTIQFHINNQGGYDKIYVEKNASN